MSVDSSICNAKFLSNYSLVVTCFSLSFDISTNLLFVILSETETFKISFYTSSPNIIILIISEHTDNIKDSTTLCGFCFNAINLAICSLSEIVENCYNFLKVRCVLVLYFQ